MSAAEGSSIEERLARAADLAEGHREVWNDSLSARDALIFEAIEHHGLSLRQTARAARVSEARVCQVVARHGATAGTQSAGSEAPVKGAEP